jgi:hypothetical protein
MAMFAAPKYMGTSPKYNDILLTNGPQKLAI